MFECIIANVKFPYPENIVNGKMISLNSDVHPCIVFKIETIGKIKYIYVAYGTSKIDKVNFKEFRTKDNDHLKYGLTKKTRWIFNAKKIARLELDSNILTKVIGKIEDELRDEIENFVNEKHIQSIINHLNINDLNMIEIEKQNEDQFW